MSDALINGLAGAGGGIVSQLITYPLQTVNTRQQTERYSKGEKKKNESGTIEQMHQVVKQEGWGRLYAGLMPSLVGKATSQHSKSIASSEEVPAMVKSPRFGTSHAIHELYAEAGVLGFWKGVLPTLIMVSNPSIQFMLYEILLKKLRQQRASLIKDGAKGITAVEIFLLGAVAKLGATMVTYPLNVVKARLQAKQVTDGDKKHQYKGTLDAVTKMIRYEGFNGFYKGMGTKVVQSVLAAAVLFMIKEELVKGARWLSMKNTVSTVRSKTL